VKGNNRVKVKAEWGIGQMLNISERDALRGFPGRANPVRAASPMLPGQDRTSGSQAERNAPDDGHHRSPGLKCA